MDAEIRNTLSESGAKLVRFVDITCLDEEQTRGFPSAVVFTLPLSKEFVTAFADGAPIVRDEFLEKERKADELADKLAETLRRAGFRACSQSEKSLEATGDYNEKAMTTPLPHKTVARLAGLGFIGRNNLLITEEFGCAFSMCTVLTDAPLPTERRAPVPPSCGECRVCKEACPSGALLGGEWSDAGGREALIDVFKCACPLACMVRCPYTLEYVRRKI